jgi:prevent-host-death family protein
MVRRWAVQTVNVQDAKTRLSELLTRVEAGETVILCRRNVPVAELKPIAQGRAEPVLGALQGRWEVPDSFFEALPDDLVAAFEASGS